jgi:hypothetical protein
VSRLVRDGMVGLEDKNEGSGLARDAAKRTKPDDVSTHAKWESAMVNVRYDHKRNTVVVEFEGNVDAEQAKQFFADLERVRPKPEKDFKLLTDFSLVDTMEFSVKRERLFWDF